jgi:hypothetical protein
MVDYKHCPHCGGDIYGLLPQIEAWELCMRVGCGRPGCNIRKGQIKLEI